MPLRALRRDRAARNGTELFLFERAFEDCLERLGLVQRRFENALLIGCPDPAWPRRLGELVAHVDVADPGALFAQAAGGQTVVEDRWEPRPDAFDLVLAIGTLDSVNDLPRALKSIAAAMRADSLFIGALSGGDTLPQLRHAMRAADAVAGSAAPHVHPRIEAAALAPLLAQAGFTGPVVDVDRVQVAYRSLDRLIADLRAMAATNLLLARSRRPLGRIAYAAAAAEFARCAEEDGKTTETFEILHLSGWAPSPDQPSPARRGSATASLADALRGPNRPD